MTAEEFYVSMAMPHINDKHDRKIQQFSYDDLIDFANQFSTLTDSNEVKNGFSDALNEIQNDSIIFAEWIKTHAKYCEPDGWKDENGLGETISSTELYERFKKSTIF